MFTVFKLPRRIPISHPYSVFRECKRFSSPRLKTCSRLSLTEIFQNYFSRFLLWKITTYSYNFGIFFRRIVNFPLSFFRTNGKPDIWYTYTHTHTHIHTNLDTVSDARLDEDCESVDAVDSLLELVHLVIVLRLLQAFSTKRTQQQSQEQIQHLKCSDTFIMLFTPHPCFAMFSNN